MAKGIPENYKHEIFKQFISRFGMKKVAVTLCMDGIAVLATTVMCLYLLPDEPETENYI